VATHGISQCRWAEAPATLQRPLGTAPGRVTLIPPKSLERNYCSLGKQTRMGLAYRGPAVISSVLSPAPLCPHALSSGRRLKLATISTAALLKSIGILLGSGDTPCELCALNHELPPHCRHSTSSAMRSLRFTSFARMISHQHMPHLLVPVRAKYCTCGASARILVCDAACNFAHKAPDFDGMIVTVLLPMLGGVTAACVHARLRSRRRPGGLAGDHPSPN
jgi:hypothetical protein